MVRQNSLSRTSGDREDWEEEKGAGDSKWKQEEQDGRELMTCDRCRLI